MSKKPPDDAYRKALKRIAKLREALENFELVCTGTLLERWKLCGKPGCRCAHDPEARHGPYYEWTRRHQGKLLHRVVTPEQARLIRKAIKNHRAILELLHRWEAETVRVIEALSDRKR